MYEHGVTVERVQLSQGGKHFIIEMTAGRKLLDERSDFG